MKYPIIISPLSEEDGGGFIAVFPDLMGCMSDGETPEEALKNATSALDEWLDTAKNRKGFVIPAPGSKAEQTRKQTGNLVELLCSYYKRIKDIDNIGDELEDLRKRICAIEDQLETNDDWERFAIITGYKQGELLLTSQ